MIFKKFQAAVECSLFVSENRISSVLVWLRERELVDDDSLKVSNRFELDLLLAHW